MTLSTAAQKDLHKLAKSRVETAINSVVQLLDDEDQVLHLSTHVLFHMTRAVADHLHAYVRRDDGSQLSEGECYAQVLGILANLGGVASAVMSEDQAKKAGLIK